MLLTPCVEKEIVLLCSSRDGLSGCSTVWLSHECHPHLAVAEVFQGDLRRDLNSNYRNASRGARLRAPNALSGLVRL